jgi:ribonuclease T2
VAAIAPLVVSGDASHAWADILADGTFAASKTCSAFLSFRKPTNPGDVNVEAGKSYPVISQNAFLPSHYRLRVEGANPSERWVSVDCGKFAAAAGSVPAGPARASSARATGAATNPAEYILALSWEPAFCENHQSKRECAGETAAGFAASHLSLHGLWPQPISKQYCNVDASLLDADRHGNWQALPAVNLSAATKTRLDAAMSGTQSSLERHEWLRHGTCYNGVDADTYFGEALTLVDAVNGSPVQALLAANIGKQITADQVRHAFDQAFGAGAGERVRLACERRASRRLLSEITIGLVGRAGSGKTPADLIMASSSTSPGCPAGEVDAVAR